jgi:RNA polymerase sigma-70 factor (ECF subfamily)
MRRLNHSPASKHQHTHMEAVIEQATRGDREAMAALVSEHYPSVFRFCAHRLGIEKAADAAQETFLTAQKRLRSFDKRSSLLTWLFGIANNHCRNLARKHRLEISFEDMWSTTPTPEGQLVDREALRVALLDLTKEHREAVVMHEIEGLTYEEIARILGIPSGTVKSRIHTAFQQLRLKLLPADQVTA